MGYSLGGMLCTSINAQVAELPGKIEALSIRDLAKYGHFDEIQRRTHAGEEVNLAKVFERAVTDFRTVKRNPGHAEIMHWCLDQGLDPEARVGPLKRTLLSLAAVAGNREIVERMRRRREPQNPFAWASLGEVDLLANYAGQHHLATMHDENGLNLLFYCAESGLGRHDEQLKKQLTETCCFLIDYGVPTQYEVQAELPISAAFLCAASGGNAQIMQLLLANDDPTADRYYLALEHCLEPHQRSGEPFYDVA
ncbi:MAG: hypothetical protein RJP95_01895, partial [Pirellulales bacterium]